MDIDLYSRVALIQDLPDEGLQKGDLATVVELYFDLSGNLQGYELEVFNALGETVKVLTVRDDQVEPLREDELLTVRTWGGGGASLKCEV